MAHTPPLSDTLTEGLKMLGRELWNGRAGFETVKGLVDELSTVPPRKISAVAEALRGSPYLWGMRMEAVPASVGIFENIIRFPIWKTKPAGPPDRAGLLTLLKQTPRLEYLFLFHGDGYVREAAVNKLSAAPSPFFIAALALRLNDWVPEVRRAAGAAIERLFGDGDAPVMAEAALFLLARTPLWSRNPVAFSILTNTFTRGDVVDALLALLLKRTDALALEAMRTALMNPAFDHHLLTIAMEAGNPAARMIAFGSLLRGDVRRRIGFEKQWIDRTFNLYRRMPAFERREIVRPLPLHDLIALAAQDRSAAVRRIAGDALVLHRRELPNIAPLLARLRNDRSAAIRQRIAFIDRDLGLELHPASGSKAP